MSNVVKLWSLENATSVQTTVAPIESQVFQSNTFSGTLSNEFLARLRRIEVRSEKDAKQKAFTQGLAMALTLSFLGLCFHLYQFSSMSNATPGERVQMFINVFEFACLFSMFSSCLAYISRSGVTFGIIYVLTFGSLSGCIVAWLNGSWAHSWQFMSVILCGLCLRVRQEQDTIIVKSLARVVLAVLIVAITLEAVDLELDFGLHMWGRKTKPNGAFIWMAYVFPVTGTYMMLRAYVDTILLQEAKAFRSVEVAYRVSEKLANYDLDAAEGLLDEARVSDGLFSSYEPLSRLLSNLRAYSPFLPHSLFSDGKTHKATKAPNERLQKLMNGREASWEHIQSAVRRLRDLDYKLLEFHEDMSCAFPELSLYDELVGTSSGRSGCEEYQRTLGALYTVYCLLRLDLDGKEVFAYGIAEDGTPLKEPIGDDAAKKLKCYGAMPWALITQMLIRAELMKVDDTGSMVLRNERVVAMLALTAFHDIMKNTVLAPTVDSQHAPFRGYAAQEKIGDHDTALEYILQHFPALLPSFTVLEPGQRVPILFSQSKMGFNNGWLVQGEAPPGALFSRFKQVIQEGRASPADINFYFVHWFTDLAGAEPYGDRPWPGAEKFTVKFPVKVLAAFLDSFTFVECLATRSEVQTMEQYLLSRVSKMECVASMPRFCDVAIMRLMLMAQDFEAEVPLAFAKLPIADRLSLTEELSRTGCKEQFERAPTNLRLRPSGPALLIYYAPALVQKAQASECIDALRILASIFRAARILFPLEAARCDETVAIRIDVLKVMEPSRIFCERLWHMRKTSSIDAEVARGVAIDENAVQIDFTQAASIPL